MCSFRSFDCSCHTFSAQANSTISRKFCFVNQNENIPNTTLYAPIVVTISVHLWYAVRCIATQIFDAMEKNNKETLRPNVKIHAKSHHSKQTILVVGVVASFLILFWISIAFRFDFNAKETGTTTNSMP